MMTGELVSFAAPMMAWICSILLTLKAPTPYPPLAASSRSCRMETRGIEISFSLLQPHDSCRQRSPAAGIAIMFMVAEADKQKMCSRTHGRASHAGGECHWRGAGWSGSALAFEPASAILNRQFFPKEAAMDQQSPENHEITHVSDTALMVAACRALETEEPDAFARDPFAARLAGERGFAILNGMQWAMVLRFGMAVRTRFFDELLTEALADSVTTVLSVGCGLDTRPWRLDLPSDLRWIEVDFPDVLDYKHGLLAGEKAHCRVERLSVDLNDPAQRETMYAAAGADSAVIITEGVLMYLPAATVEGLA